MFLCVFLVSQRKDVWKPGWTVDSPWAKICPIRNLVYCVFCKAADKVDRGSDAISCGTQTLASTEQRYLGRHEDATRSTGLRHEANRKVHERHDHGGEVNLLTVDSWR